MAIEITDIARFTTKLEPDCNSFFLLLLLKSARRWPKVIASSFTTKNKIVNYLKEQDTNYAVPDIEEPLKVIIRGIYNSSNPDSIQIEL